MWFIIAKGVFLGIAAAELASVIAYAVVAWVYRRMRCR
jgi:hypothetical protein